MTTLMLPLLKTSVPGPQSKKLLRRLRHVECLHVTYSDADFPVFWSAARGASVTDADGNRFLDLTAAFAVANLGHTPPAVRRAAVRQMGRTWHAMGDVHPHEAKIDCAERVLRLLGRPFAKVYFSNSGFEAVETAMKTAFLMTGRPGVIAFEGAYHGLGYGALQATHRRFFRDPFIKQTGDVARFARFVTETAAPDEVRRELKRVDGWCAARGPKPVGAILIEPIQGRGGVRAAHPAFLKGLRAIAARRGVALIFDEIFTGFGRTGKWFAFEHSGVRPDLVTLGKGMANGFPISLCAGTEKAMAAWGPCPGEARHTSTFLGNPLGCAMAVATLSELEKKKLPQRAARLGPFMKRGLGALVAAFPDILKEARGRGLMWGLEFRDPKKAGRAVKALLKKGVLVLGSGEKSETLSITPPLVITGQELGRAFSALKEVLGEF